MRIPPRLQLVLMVVFVGLLALSVLMIILYMGAVNKTPQLEDDIAQKEAQIAAIEDQCNIDQMTAERDEYLNKIANEAPFPAPPFPETSIYDDQQITDAVFKVTDDAYVLLESWSQGKEASRKIGDGTYRADTYTLKCKIASPDDWGRLITLLELLEELREDLYDTLLLDNVKLPGGRTSIDMQFIIVTQRN